jgi:hypothetical protein
MVDCQHESGLLLIIEKSPPRVKGREIKKFREELIAYYTFIKIEYLIQVGQNFVLYA